MVFSFLYKTRNLSLLTILQNYFTAIKLRQGSLNFFLQYKSQDFQYNIYKNWRKNTENHNLPRVEN